MIKEVKGNLLDDDAQGLVNTVNTQGVMGKGLALQFRERFPMNYNLYRKACKSGQVTVGQMFVTEDDMDGKKKIIINFPTKTSWRKPSEYSYIEKGLTALKKEIEYRKLTSVAIPPLGSRNGGLNWDVIKGLIYKYLSDVECEIRLYEPSEVILDKLKSEKVRLTPARVMLLSVFAEMNSYGEICSVFAAEKIVYFLQKFGASDIFKINFQKSFYGPYSGGKIAHVLYYLNGSYIMGMTGMDVRPFDPIWLTDDVISVTENFFDNNENKRYREITEATKEFLQGFYSQYSLELLSTIDYLFTYDEDLILWHEKDTESLEPIVNEKLAQWSNRKRALYSGTNHVRKVIDYLKSATKSQSGEG